MGIQLRLRKNRNGLGFTLVELLLTVALLMALLAAIVFNFSSLRAGADLEEGGRQFEALVRFASAQAANSGRTIQFRFGDEAAGTNDPVALEWEEPAKLRLVTEFDPVNQPGIFSDVLEAAPMLEEIEQRVRVEAVNIPGRPMNQSTNEMDLEAPVAGFPAITFFPDGSTDTAEIVLASRDELDFRRLKIRLEGVTGALRSELSRPEELVPLEWMDDEGAVTEQKTVTAPAETTSPIEMPVKETAKDEFEDDFPE